MSALLFAAWSPSDSLTVKSFYPANGVAGQCLDTPLRMVLSGKAVLKWNGTARIRNLATNAVVKSWVLSGNPGHPDQTNVRASWPWQDSVGHTVRNVWPVVIDSIPEPLAEIRIPRDLLQPDTRYQVEVDAGILAGTDGSSFGGVPAGAWTFTTRKSRPVSKNRVVVAEDNSGDVCSVQAGLDLVPSGSGSLVQVLIKPGYYREMIAAEKKDNLELFGAGADRTILRYCNSNNLNDGSKTRNLALLGGNGMQIRALAFVNTIGVTGGQAEALNLQGDRNIVADVLLRSHQDTWLNSGGRAYVQDAAIEGSVDFIWGYSATYFKRCTLVFTRKGSVIVQPRNPAGTHGYVFDSCTLKARSSEFTESHFARDAGAEYPDGEVVFLNTTLIGGVLAASPWTFNAGMDETKLNFCEYRSRDANGILIAVTNAQRKAHQCTESQALQFADPGFVLAGWKPSVPSLDSVLSLVPTSARFAHRPEASAKAKWITIGAGRELEIHRPGTAVVREILPDGTRRHLFHCEAPCRGRIETASTVPAWLEVVQAEGRIIIPTNH